MRYPLFILSLLASVLLPAAPVLAAGAAAQLQPLVLTVDAGLPEALNGARVVVDKNAGSTSVADKTPASTAPTAGSVGYVSVSGTGDFPQAQLALPVEDTFAVAAVIRIDATAAEGSHAIAELSGLLGDQALLRLQNGQVDFRVRVKNVWYRVTSFEKVPLGRWTLVAGMIKGDRLYSVVDGRLDRTLLYPQMQPRGPFTTLTLGRYGRGQWFNGDIAKVALFPGAVDLDRLAAEWGIQPPASTQQTEVKSVAGKVFPPEKALRVGDNVIHPIVDSGGANITMVPWSGPDGLEMISTGAFPLYAPRAGLLRPLGADETFVAQGLSYPLYDEGQTLPFRGQKLDVVHRPDGLFDLIAYGGDTLFRDGHMTYYRNSGRVGEPKFEHAIRKGVGGVSVIGALGEEAHSLAVVDVDGDGVPDLILITREERMDHFPDRIGTWVETPSPNVGRGRGYDVAGNWLGDRLTAKVFWAKGRWSADNELEFEPVRPVYVGAEDDYQVQWHTSGLNVHAGALALRGEPHLLLAADVDQVLALPLHTDAAGDLRTGAAVPLLEDGAPLIGTYFNSVFSYADLDGDGVQEIVMSGNTGRPTVLKGDWPGNFREVGTLNRRGGFIEMDTLAVPLRTDWTGDGYPDIISGDASGWLWFWPGTADPLVYGEPSLFQLRGQPLRHIAGPSGSMQGPSESGWGYLNPTAGDWDNNGQPVIVTNDIKGELLLYRPVAPGSLELQPPQRITHNGKPLATAWRSRPAILPAKWNEDGVPRLIFMDWDGDLAIARPVETGSADMAEVAKLSDAAGEAMQFCAPWGGNWGRTKFTVTDWDGDGTWDIVFGTIRLVHKNFLPEGERPSHSTPFLLRNIGTNDKPVFAAPVPIRKRDGSLINTGHHVCSVWPTDLTGDGSEDLMIGSEDGKVYYFMREELELPKGE